MGILSRGSREQGHMTPIRILFNVIWIQVHLGTFHRECRQDAILLLMILCFFTDARSASFIIARSIT